MLQEQLALHHVIKCMFYSFELLYPTLFLIFSYTGYHNIYKMQDKGVCHAVTPMKIEGFHGNPTYPGNQGNYKKEVPLNL